MDERKKPSPAVETWSIPEKPFTTSSPKCAEMTFQPTHRGLVRQVWMSGTPHWIPDVSRDKAFQRAQLAAKAGLHGAFRLPVLAGNVTLAVLEFFSREIRNPDRRSADGASDRQPDRAVHGRKQARKTSSTSRRTTP